MKQKHKVKIHTKLPLYLGLGVFILSVIISGMKVGGEQLAYMTGKTSASTATASLTLRYSSPDLVSVSLDSQKDVAGVDAVLKYDKEAMSILPSTLAGGPQFITSGGVIDESKNTFSFNGLAKSPVSTGIVATFKIIQVNGVDRDIKMDFVVGTNGSAVIEKISGENILNSTSGVKFTVSSK